MSIYSKLSLAIHKSFYFIGSFKYICLFDLTSGLSFWCSIKIG
ncbi:hypothetical protein C1G86_0778 [Dehalococcoides mccartyi]|uniref:Uncharacterized protein n=1 Tax=Dehalococcoides mccartyi TaxID=61435 RepID=A0A142V9V9_9CHLR|nr:hypothetical protein Dm11a5_0742 [Dehalococcoides mccartyi]AOV99391.1 hypothetical protein DCWBC2_0751 [Dehalococcoides mccartyi]MBA2085179.1 hypothetical protein [Dehalococcoides mccartyi]RAL69697.1 hypothetical protein C1G87_0776 [Dehalococcoides mccartyi]RAL71024.1 hypothetical protein C1G86_0778 [Dehalococcoides mccartyi]